MQTEVAKMDYHKWADDLMIYHPRTQPRAYFPEQHVGFFKRPSPIYPSTKPSLQVPIGGFSCGR